MLCYIIHRYYAFDIGEPELVYAIHISVQQREYVYNTTTKKEEAVWKTVGEAAVGPKVFGRKITSNKLKESPEVRESIISTGIMTECSVGHQALDIHVYTRDYVQSPIILTHVQYRHIDNTQIRACQ